MTQYIAYYRVSTQRQGQSGLGLDAQRSSVMSFIRNEALVAEYTDIESGKHDNRPELLKALDHSTNIGAVLLIAKLDRLSRNVTFISTLIDRRVRFTCCDMPEANELTIHLMAALAQWERKAISKRVTEALAAKKSRGFKLGGTVALSAESIKMGHQARRDSKTFNPNNTRAKAYISSLRKEGKTLKEIAAILNSAGFKTSTGKTFSPTQVSRLL